MKHVSPPDLPFEVAELDPSQCFLLWAMRCWVRCCKNDCLPAAPVERAFEQVGIDGAASRLDDALRSIAHAAARPLAIHCPRCPGLSDDEMLLLRATAAVQHRAFGSARRSLDAMLRPTSTGYVIDRLSRLAETMTFAGLLLPEPDLDDGAGLTAEPASATLH